MPPVSTRIEGPEPQRPASPRSLRSDRVIDTDVPLWSNDPMDKLKMLAVAAGVGTGAMGAWAFFSPTSFYDFATYPPFSEHFIHDIGSFMLGLGAVLLLAAWSSSALFVAFGGNAIGSVFHFIAHLMDRRSSPNGTRDVILIGVLTATLAAAAYATRSSGKKPI